MFDHVRLFPSDSSDKFQIDRLEACWHMIQYVFPPGPAEARRIPLEELLSPIEEALDVLLAEDIDYISIHYGTMLQHLRATCYMVHSSLEGSQMILESTLEDVALVTVEDIQDVEHRRLYVLLAENTKEALEGCIRSRRHIASLAAQLNRELAAAADAAEADAADKGSSDKGPGPEADGGASLAVSVEQKDETDIERIEVSLEQTTHPGQSSTIVHCHLDFSSLFPPIISHSIVSRPSVEILKLPACV